MPISSIISEKPKNSAANIYLKGKMYYCLNEMQKWPVENFPVFTVHVISFIEIQVPVPKWPFLAKRGSYFLLQVKAPVSHIFKLIDWLFL